MKLVWLSLSELAKSLIHRPPSGAFFFLSPFSVMSTATTPTPAADLGPFIGYVWSFYGPGGICTP